MAFGAHFPLDVLLGTLLGWQVGLFSVALLRAARLLPAAGEPQRGTVAQPGGPVPAADAAPA
jgi:membrane-associated phospholipid phosphatase